MKKITLFLIIIFISIGIISQTPQAFKYQAVVRDNLGAIIANQEVSFRISIHDETPTGTILYQEIHDVTTNDFGVANLVIGDGDPPITGFIEDIDWGTNEKFMEVELDPDGNSAYVSMGTTQLLAVPYSLYSESTGDTSRWRKNMDDLYYLDGKVGIGTPNPQVLLDVKSSSEDIGSSIYLNNSNETHWLQLFGGRGGVSPVYPTLYWQEGDGLRFGTYGTLYTERMRISDMGNVGIGTSIPDEKLSIRGNIMLRDEGYDPYIKLISDDASDGTTEYIWSEDAKGLAFGDTHGSPQVLIEHETGNVGIGTDAPEESAKLEVNSNSQGFLLPRMSTSEIGGISNPADGLQAYNTDDGRLYIFVASLGAWQEISYGTSTIPVLANYTIGTGGNCDNTVISGIYFQDMPLNSNHFITMEVNVLSLGDYIIHTDTVNGYFFTGTGTFVSTGIQTTQLFGDGMPIVAQTDNFTATASNDGGSCTFTNEVQELNCGGTITDIDGNNYYTVQIGTQCWMKENLKTTTYNNGTPIPNITDDSTWETLTTASYVWYDNNINWKNDYGALYNWFATVEPNGLCPTGWHVPTHDEWVFLIDFIGSNDSGEKLKSCRQANSPMGYACSVTSPPYWREWSCCWGTDDYGFSALPGGCRSSDGAYLEIHETHFCWLSSENSPLDAWHLQMHYGSYSVYINTTNKQNGYSVRCIKD